MTELLRPAETEKKTETLRPGFDVGFATDVGRERDHNEDTVAVVREAQFGMAGGREQGMLGVFDGMGGHGAGEVASSLAARVATREYLAGRNSGEAGADFAKRVVSAANRKVFDERKTRGTDMGTTAVMAIQDGNHFVVANVGDSRAYRIKPDGIAERLTTDHSLVQRLVDINQITPEEAKTHKQRNIIYRTIGDKPRVEADVIEVDLVFGERLLLCSDGLCGMVEDQVIGRIVKEAPSAQAASEAVIGAANAAGGEDNISAIVVKYGPEPKTADESKMLVDQVINNIAAEISGGKPDRQRLTQLITELLSGAVALAADRKKLNKTIAFALKVAQKYHLDFG